MSAVRRVCALMFLLAPSAAYAGNGTHPRTPVLWEPAPACMTIVDRTASPVLELTYTIPYEDLRPVDAVDEVDDSRRHQFLAFCRGHSVQEPLPIWLSQADVDAADAKDLVNPLDLTAEDVFDTSVAWQDCVVRITGDDERRLINFAEAAKPVVWDTTGIPVGPYVVNGYTWEPAFNVYSLRSGVVKVIDDPDPAASPPALAISDGPDDAIVYETEALRLYGCVSAMDGSTITGSWAHTNNEGAPLTWQVFAADVPVAGDTFEMMFMPPAETVKKLVALKIDITDPMDRTFTAHMDLLASVLPGSPPAETGGECDSMGFIQDPSCGDTGGTTGEGSSEGSGGATGTGTGTASVGSEGPTEVTGGGSDSTGPGQQPGGGEGCGGCVVGGGTGVSFMWLVVPWCVGRRRRSAVRA